MAVGYGALRQDIQNFHNTSLSLTSELKELRIAVVDMKSFMAAQEERNKRMDSLDHRITKLEERRLNE